MKLVTPILLAILFLSSSTSAFASTSLTVTAQSQDGSKTFAGLTFQCSQSNGDGKPGSDGKIAAPTHSTHTTNGSGQFTWNAPGDGTVSCFIKSAPPECYYPLPRQVSSVSGGAHTYLFAYDEASCFINANPATPVQELPNAEDPDLEINEAFENQDPVEELEQMETMEDEAESPADSDGEPVDETPTKPSFIQRILGWLRKLFL